MRCLLLLLTIGVSVSLVAQAPPVPAPVTPTVAQAPAIVLLCKAAPRIHAEASRKRWAAALAADVGRTPQELGAWLQPSADGLIGGRDAVRFMIRQEQQPRPLGEQQMQHLDDDERQRLLEHAAVVEVVCTSPLSKDQPRAEVYRVLAGVAASLGLRGVLGIAAMDHGEYRMAPESAELSQGLRSEDPLGWLMPTSSTSLAVFLRKPVAFVAEDIAARVGKELGVEFGSNPDAKQFVVVRDDLAAVKVRGMMVMLSARAPMDEMKSALEQYGDLRVRKHLEEHQALLHLLVIGPGTETAEAERRQLLARIAAALWSDDCLLLSWHCSKALVPAGEDTLKALRGEDPVAATLANAPVPVVLATDGQAMERAIARARQEWPTAVEHHAKGGELTVKLPFRTRRNGTEHIWVQVTRIEGDTVSGLLANEPTDIEGKKIGDPVTGKVAELSDWLFLRNGEMVGGFTVKVLQAQGEKRRK